LKLRRSDVKSRGKDDQSVGFFAQNEGVIRSLWTFPILAKAGAISGDRKYFDMAACHNFYIYLASEERCRD
jgi:hypothetical protein